jgi:hypothetical protein
MTSPSHAYTVLPARTVQGSAFDWAHEVRIALPPSYAGGDRTYPVIWATDASLSFPLTVGTMSILTMGQQAAEAIIVGVGAPASVDALEFGRRRAYEFYTRPRWLNGGLGGQYALKTMPDAFPPELLDGGGGAERFLSFLVDDLRPRLAREFRFDETDHGLLGDSAGGHFATYALLTRTEAFTKYLIGSPAVSGCEDYLFQLEEERFTRGPQLRGDLFLGAGEAEATDTFTAVGDILGSMTRLAQTLRLRDYPGLRITCRIFPDQNHYSAAPSVINSGLRHLYATT